MARNTLRLDTKGFEEMLRKLDSLGDDVTPTVEKMLSNASKQIAKDTDSAMDSANLPAKGKYSIGTTEKSIIHDSRVEWEGLVGWVPVGFDFSKPGAGGYLITGTPKMRPDYALNKMYKQKKYMNQIQRKMADIILSRIIKKMEDG